MSFFEKCALIFTNPKYLDSMLTGLRTTIAVSLGAAALGLVLGTIVALIGLANTKNPLMKPPKLICAVYVTVVRGTPMALQLFIMAFVVLAIRNFPLVITAIIAFGVNSGAYVSENIRGGILSVDIGQTEAGRSLGLSAGETMWYIVIPQAIKNVIPSIGNELIALIKETSIVSMIGMYDLTASAKILGSGQYLASYGPSMTAAALFYLAIVYLLTLIIKIIEGRLRQSDRR